MTTTTETLPFQAEVKELLGLMIHSLYSHKEIFLRELISNASDALDKLRFEALTRPEILPAEHRPMIRLEVDPGARVLRVIDNGVGMSREELVANLGTIARSGTRKFLEAARDRGAGGLPQLIGQFGVGFYASFMVAQEIVVETRRAGETQGSRWRSRGDGEYTVEDAELAEAGTKIELALKPVEEEGDAQDFADPDLLAELVRRYSDFVEYPLVIAKSALEHAHGLKEDVLPDGTPVWILNSQKPLWARAKDEITPEEHAEFYRHLTHDWSPPLAWVHFKAEGEYEYTALLYLPSERPPAFLETQRERSQISLYVRRVFVMAECEDLLPTWLRFVRGVVDSQDLPLNVSREILQANRAVTQIKKRLTRKVLETMGTLLRERRGDYVKFWTQFGAILKEGLVVEPSETEAIAEVCLFASTQGDDLTTLDEYISRTSKDQKEILYLSAQDRESAARSPHLEALRARGVEVLFFTDPVDDWVVQHLREFRGKPLKAIDRGSAQLESDEVKLARQQQEREARGLLERLEEHLAGDVASVRFSSRLKDSPSVLVDDEHAPGVHMERMMRQARGDAPKRRRVLELNPAHPLIQRLTELFAAEPGSPKWKDYSDVLYAQALLAEGSPVPDPARFSKLVTEWLLAATPPPAGPASSS